MNNITTPKSDSKSNVPRHLETLTTTVFQSLFPRINPQTTPLKSIRRVLLLDREPAGDGDDEGSFILSFRHYAITTKPAGMSKPLRRLNAAERLLHTATNTKKSRKGGLPNLGKLHDISEYLIGGDNGEGYVTDGATSGSDVDTDGEVEVLESAPRRMLKKSSKARAENGNDNDEAADDDVDGDDNDDKVERRRVTLTELGPRMRLRMTKVEEGMCAGKTMWHETIQKSRQEVQELERRWEGKRAEKEARRKEQKANVEKKKKEKAPTTAKSSAAGKDGEEGDDDDDDEGEGVVDDDYDMDGNNSDLFDEMMEQDVEDDEDDEEFDSEGLAGDAEELLHVAMDEDEWVDEEAEIANARS